MWKVLRFSQIEVGIAFNFRIFLRPQIPLLTLMAESRGIQRKGIKRRFNLAFFLPFTG